MILRRCLRAPCSGLRFLPAPNHRFFASLSNSTPDDQVTLAQKTDNDYSFGVTATASTFTASNKLQDERLDEDESGAASEGDAQDAFQIFTGRRSVIARAFREKIREKRRLNRVGAGRAPVYQPRFAFEHPPHASQVTLESLLAAQTHFGHVTSIWHPGNARYICGIREGTHIISLEATASYLRRAARIVEAIAYRGGLVLFVGTRSGNSRIVVKAANLAGGYHVVGRWMPGSITNREVVLPTSKLKAVDEFDQPVQNEEVDKLIAEHGKLKPDLVVCLNPGENFVLLHECRLNDIPTIGIIDTNINPALVTYPIPANDDSNRSVQLIAGVLGQAGWYGRKKRRDAAEKGIVTYLTDEATLTARSLDSAN